ncbi:glycosyltransferase family 1 protein [Spongiibacter sp. KMU-158]|uniref:Glycosyltransferase family 1 protein n=1 Tax=Spongiibacter pelagi TaxID=2760804 RepID=A0A927C4D4_9GAMM|nr:glycosyltransferase [Spongiibacter pelagi]MBD2859376.1 glycosyltransferase family 1 protein [Spongiibacter pelagi]
MRVLHITYNRLRSYGANRVSWAQKLEFGLIRDEHYVQDFSDRDVASFSAPLGIRELGFKKANKRLLELSEAFEPDLVIVGHTDIVTLESLREIRRQNPGCLIIHCNCDPLFVPNNDERIARLATEVDAVFVTTGRRELKRYEGLGARLYHIPNPVDGSVENLDNSQKTDLDIDLLFCGNETKHTKRYEMLSRFREQLKDEMNFKTYGYFGEPTVWGRDYDRVLARTRMALNLNRQDNEYWYSSDRMAQLAGNGVLFFTHSATRFDELLPEESAVYFDDEDSLLAGIREFHHDDDKRRHWASRAREFFHQEINSQLCSRFMIEAATETPFSHDYVWARDINLDGSMK